MYDENNTIKKVVFREADDLERPKVVWGTVKDLGDFIEVITKENNKFTINKRYLVFIKERGQ